MTLFSSCVPVGQASVTVSWDAQCQDPEIEAAKLNSANFTIKTLASAALATFKLSNLDIWSHKTFYGMAFILWCDMMTFF